MSRGQTIGVGNRIQFADFIHFIQITVKTAAYQGKAVSGLYDIAGRNLCGSRYRIGCNIRSRLDLSV